MRQKLVAGNWKMHGSLQGNVQLLEGLKGACADFACQVVVFPSYPYLQQVASLVLDSPIKLGAQNLSEHPQGAYTGEVSAAMLRDFSCSHVLVGHSERRTLFGETDFQVAQKFAAAIKGGVTPVLCVGETLAERESGETLLVIEQQINAVLDLLGVQGLRQGIVAYEPVWAIGTGLTATPEQAQWVHREIRTQIALRDEVVANELMVLYGGSVKPQNAASLFAQPDIDGGLIGGAALVVDDFLAICRAANLQVKK